MNRTVLRHEAVVAPIALVLDSPHSGEWYPDDFDHAPPRALVRQAEDTHVARLWSAATGVGATLIEARFPRAYIDVNRALADMDVALLSDAWPHAVGASRKAQQGIGLVWRLAPGGVPMYARQLTSVEVTRRIDYCWRPYHAELAQTLDARHDAFGGVWHLNCHSMPAVGDRMADDPGCTRADFVLGDRDGTTCAPAFTRLVGETVRAFGYSVAVNAPYKGVELVRKHGRPAENRHSLQVEIKRTLYMDERTLVPHDGYARLQRDLARLLAVVANHVKADTAPIGPTT